MLCAIQRLAQSTTAPELYQSCQRADLVGLHQHQSPLHLQQSDTDQCLPASAKERRVQAVIRMITVHACITATDVWERPRLARRAVEPTFLRRPNLAHACEVLVLAGLEAVILQLEHVLHGDAQGLDLDRTVSGSGCPPVPAWCHCSQRAALAARASQKAADSLQEQAIR